MGLVLLGLDVVIVQEIVMDVTIRFLFGLRDELGVVGCPADVEFRVSVVLMPELVPCVRQGFEFFLGWVYLKGDGGLPPD